MEKNKFAFVLLVILLGGCARFFQDLPLLSGTVSPGGKLTINDGGTSSSFTQSPKITWTTSGVSGINHYTISIGTKPGATDVMGWTNVGSATSYQASGLSLAQGTTYYVNVEAIDGTGKVIITSSSSGFSAFDLTADPDPSIIDPISGCPIGYIFVPATASSAVTAFCVSKYEMRVSNANGSPSPRPDGLPYPNASRISAKAACATLGPKYALMTNEQWQALAHQIETVGDNWSGGAVGSGAIYRGYSTIGTGWVDGLCHDFVSVSNLNDPYDQTGHSASDPLGGGKEQRRTLEIPNGNATPYYNEVWDLAGNVWEIVDTTDTFGCTATQNAADCYNLAIGGQVYLNQVTGAFKAAFGPMGDYSSEGQSNLYGGLGAVEEGSAGGALWRGEASCHETKTGLYAVHMGLADDQTSTDAGFRCVYLP